MSPCSILEIRAWDTPSVFATLDRLNLLDPAGAATLDTGGPPQGPYGPVEIVIIRRTEDQ